MKKITTDVAYYVRTIPKTKDIRDIEQEFKEYIESCLGANNSPQIIEEIKCRIYQHLHSLLAIGRIFEMPLVDINHEEEIKYIRAEMKKLRNEGIEKNIEYGTEEYYDYHNRMENFCIRVNGLTSQCYDPNVLIISLKDPKTFEILDGYQSNTSLGSIL